jgi:predicted ATP-grasp superfamily ATP-dependent carboligase
MSEAGGIHAARVVEVSGLATTSWKDQTGTVNQDFVAGTTLSVSASGANTQADEIAFVAFGYTLSNAWTAGSGFTDLGIVTDSTLSLLPAYKILSGIETTTAAP